MYHALAVSGRQRRTWRLRRRTEVFVGVCVIVSGSVHGLVTQAHFQEWWGYGVFFLATAILLIGYGLALVTDAIDPRYMPGDVHAIRRLLYALGAIGNAGILGLYLLTRTAGIPLGPGFGTVEPVGALDLLAKAAEVLALCGLIVLLIKSRPGSRVG
ncbi:MAG TPA: hypothetical protein VIN01_03920 [Candidatus Dormibacteraeota bacterium]